MKALYILKISRKLPHLFCELKLLCLKCQL
jgi:hypothetical protein